MAFINTEQEKACRSNCSMLHQDEVVAMEGRPLYVLNALQILAAIVALWMLVRWKTHWNAMRYIGTVLTVAGISMVAVARCQLGKSFSARAEAHELVTHGLYSKIRNPIYVFGNLYVAGLLLVLQQPILVIVLAILIIVQAVRARREARVLEAAFGDAYRQYRSKTWF
ncbi:MAG: isoprenylcysteine carboxylmethyltransferase family protein [Candidatus Korobacteraceae bacterium]